MSSDTPRRPKKSARQVTQSKATEAVKPNRARAGRKSVTAPTQAVKPKPLSKSAPKRQCGACLGIVSASALYCRHCGKALSAEVPANPFLPPPPKPWRPSRIPKQRAPLQQATLASSPDADSVPSQTWRSPLAVSGLAAKPPLATPAPAQSAHPPEPPQPRVWDPVPEVEQRMAQLRAIHDRLRPQLARADLFKRRLRHP